MCNVWYGIDLNFPDSWLPWLQQLQQQQRLLLEALHPVRVELLLLLCLHLFERTGCILSPPRGSSWVTSPTGKGSSCSHYSQLS